MIKLQEIIKKTAFEYATAPGEDGEIEERSFKDGAEFIINNIMALQNFYPLAAIVTIQVDPQTPENKLISAKISGLDVMELVTLIIRFAQGQLDRLGKGMDHELVLMPKEEAARRRAFQESLNLVREERKLKPD